MNGRAFAALAGQERVLIIRRPFVDWLGHVSDALLFDQLIYWQEAAGIGAWVPITDAQLAAHLCLTEYEISQARARLVSAGWLEAERRGIPARMQYRLDVDAAFRAFSAFVSGGSAQQSSGDGATSNPDSPDWRGDSAEHTTYKLDKDILLENKNHAPNPDAAPVGQRRRGRPRKVRPDADGGGGGGAEAGGGARTPGRGGGWPDFRARVLGDYGAVGSRGNHALVTNCIRTAADVHGLAEQQALAAWAEFWEGLTKTGQTKYVPLSSAANRFGQWLRATIAERRRSNAG